VDLGLDEVEFFIISAFLFAGDFAGSFLFGLTTTSESCIESEIVSNVTYTFDWTAEQSWVITVPQAIGSASIHPCK
jgi:hypothetical protein